MTVYLYYRSIAHWRFL